MGNLSHFDPGWHGAIADPLPTSSPELILRRIDRVWGTAVASVVRANHEHLTRHGDYEELVAMDREALVQHFVDADCYEGALVVASTVRGVASLIRYQPTVFGIGYWLAADATGRGFATRATATLCDVARGLGGSEIWAGIRPHNRASIAVVERLGFALARRQHTHLSYRRSLE